MAKRQWLIRLIFTLSISIFSALSLAKATYYTQNGDTSAEGFGSLSDAANWAWGTATSTGIQWCTNNDDFRPAGIQEYNDQYYWTYACNEHLNQTRAYPIRLLGCPDPFTQGSNGQCEKRCPSGQPYNSTTGQCPLPPDCDGCDRTPNPISILSGWKYRNIDTYVGNGQFPLKVSHYYNSLGNMNRTATGLSEDPDYPIPDISFDTYTTPALGPKRHHENIALAAPIPEEDQELERYIGNVDKKWRHYYDRYLLASYNWGEIDPETTPEVVRIYRPDGEDEIYIWNVTEGAYLPQNGYESQVTRLDENHEYAPGWHVVNSEGVIEIYSFEGQLLQLTSPSGLSQYLSYDAEGIRLQTVADDFGHTLQFFYNDSSDSTLLTRVTDPDGHDYLFAYNARGMLTSITYPDLTPGDANDNPSRVYLYEDSRFPDALTGIIDENGDVFQSYEYDSSGRATVSELAGGAERVAVTYDDANASRTLVNALGLETVYQLNGNRQISSIERLVSSSGRVSNAIQNFTYDSNLNRNGSTDYEGNTTSYIRDSRGLELNRVEAVGTADQRTIATTWHAQFRLPVQIVEPGKTTDFTYDSDGNLLSRTETDTTIQAIPYSTNGRTRTWTYTYHPEGSNGQYLMASQDGPRTDVNDTTTYTYTSQGFIATITNPAGHTVQITDYNSRGQPLSMTDANGVVTNMTYHPRGWLLTSTVVDPAGSNDAITTNEYDAVGQLTRVTLPNGAYLDYEYDAAHRLTAISNNLGERQEFTLDAAGNITAEVTKDAFGSISRTQTRIYDELSRIYEVIGGAGQVARMSYDDNGNETSSVLDPSGINQSTLQAFDALDRLITVTDALNNDSEFSYDGRDNLISVTDQRGLVTNYTYDGLDNLIQLNSPDTGITVYTYDDAGNQLSQTDARGVVTNYSYDELNRLTAVTYSGNPSEDIAYTYDQGMGGFGIGRLTQIDDQTGSTNLVYDHRGNQIESSVVIQGNSYTTAYAYDLADNLVATTYPSGRVVEHQLDSLGRTASLATSASTGGASQTLADNIDYLPFGPMQALEYGNDLSLTIGNDSDYRITAIDVADIAGVNPAVMSLGYSQNPVDNITAITDAVDSTKSQSFVYDQLNRLTEASGAYGDQTYTYDGVGNRLSLTTSKDGDTSGETYTYDQNSNRLLSVDRDGVVRTFQYDANGNIISDDRGADTGFTFDYNDQNRLNTATPQGAQQ